MRPINSRYFGPDAGRIQVSYHNGAATTTGYIAKQLSYNRYRVTSDGTTFFDIALAQTVSAADTLTEGFGTINLSLTGSGAILAPVLEAAVVTSQIGSGYQVGDTITVGGGTGTPIVVTVATVNSGAVTSVTLTNRGSYTVLPGNINDSLRVPTVTTTSGSGSGVRLDIGFRVKDIAITSPGTGYIVGQALTFTGTGGGSPTITVASVDATGGVATFTFTNRGSGIYNVATVTAASTIHRIARLWGSRCTTVEGVNTPWSRLPAASGMAQIQVI